MRTLLSINVVGIPQPQGSAKAFMPRGAQFPVVTTDNKRLYDWRNLVRMYAAHACRSVSLGPVTIKVLFRLPRPKKPKHAEHLTPPDLDKLVRGLGDALSGVVYQDDSQVVSIAADKRYCEPLEQPGAVIAVEEN